MAIHEDVVRIAGVTKVLRDEVKRIADVLDWLRILDVWHEAVVRDDRQETTRSEERADASVDEVRGGGKDAISSCEGAAVDEDQDRRLGAFMRRRVIHVQL